AWHSVIPLNLGVKIIAKDIDPSLVWLEVWMREAFLRLNSTGLKLDSTVIINFSHTVSIYSSVWYLQGAPSIALSDIKPYMPLRFKLIYNFMKPLIDYSDRRLVEEIYGNSVVSIANSRFCASMYSRWGVKVHSIVYPPIDTEVFHPSTSKPSSDYVLAYFGKETKFDVIEKVADRGVKIKAFGSRMLMIPKRLLRHPNIEFLGRVPAEKLVDLYSNALYTLFPFTHEPFGYIPLESMACGTPVLTYNAQGPAESIIDEVTGWLVKDDRMLVDRAIELWMDGYDPMVRRMCRERASGFDKARYIERWVGIIDKFCRGVI
ncbi:MAG: glycosyltransferase, partial [Candidatus Bathyarchaeia archaeon]